MLETYTFEVPAALGAVRESVERLLAWLRLQGHSAAAVKRWKLPVTEAVTNGIRHGCSGRTGATLILSACIGPAGTEVSVRDPGHFAPGPDFGRLPRDPLAESGRGGFLIARETDSFEHCNGPDGHVLVLRWKETPALLHRVVSAAQNEEALDQLAEQLGDTYETVTAYADFAGWLATTGDFNELLSRVRERLARAVAHECFVLRFIDGGHLVLGVPAGGFSPAILLTEAALEAKVAQTGNCVAFASPAEIPAGDPLAGAAGPVVVVAVGCPERQRGTLTLIRAANARAFTAGNIAFAQAVANFLGTARATAELWAQRARQIKFEQELELAARLQNSLLPQTPPSLAAWTVAGGCCQSRAIGGDYFDWTRRADGSCLVLVADVMGKGLPAAMVATILRSTWRTLAAYEHGPGRLLTELNGPAGC